MLEHCQQWLSRRETAERIQAHGVPCSPESLATKAWNGSGPVYRIVSGRSRYLVADVDAWIATRISKPGRQASEIRRDAQGAAA